LAILSRYGDVVNVGPVLDALLYELLPVVGIDTEGMTGEEMRGVIGVEGYEEGAEILTETVKDKAIEMAKQSKLIEI
jgi:hypothetical protein